MASREKLQPVARAIRKLLIVQVLLTIVAALVAYGLHGHLGVTGSAAAGAAVYGGVIAWVNALLLARQSLRMGRAAQGSLATGGLDLMARVVFTLVAFALGIGLWKLCPPAVILGFAVPQLGFVLGRQKLAEPASK